MEKEEMKQKIRSLISEFFKLFVVTVIGMTIAIWKLISPEFKSELIGLLIVVTFGCAFCCGSVYFLILKYLKLWKKLYGNHITIKELLNHENK